MIFQKWNSIVHSEARLISIRVISWIYYLYYHHIKYIFCPIVKYFNEHTLIVLNDKYFNNFGPVPVTRFDPLIHQVLYIGHQSIFSFDTLVIKRVEKYLIKNKSTKRRKILYPRRGTTLLVKSISPTFSGSVARIRLNGNKHRPNGRSYRSDEFSSRFSSDLIGAAILIGRTRWNRVSFSRYSVRTHSNKGKFVYSCVHVAEMLSLGSVVPVLVQLKGDFFVNYSIEPIMRLSRREKW